MASKSTRTSQTGGILHHLDANLFPQWEQRRLDFGDREKSIGDLVRTLKLARKDFDSKLLFIVVFGPVKSGKSTLVNSLAREYVSPTRFAQECTRRASIVLKSEDPGIDVYYRVKKADESAATAQEREEKAFDLIVQYLRGLAPESALSGVIHKESHDYTKDNVDRLLSADVEDEPLITVIRSPGGKLISDEIAILDVPGLDGFHSNYVDTPASFWVVNRADFLIFAQSSFSPLNHQTCEFLRDFYIKSKRPPVWMVQNKMEARYWVHQSVREQEAEVQLRIALNEVSTLLGVSANELPHCSINLGKASDGIFNKEYNLLHESRFEQFEERLVEELNRTRMKVLEKNSLNQLDYHARNVVHKLREIVRDIELELEKDGDKLESLRSLLNRVDSIGYDNGEVDKAFHDFFYAEVKDLEDGAKGFAHEACQKALEPAKAEAEAGKGKRLKGREANGYLKAVAGSIGEDLATKRFVLLGELGRKLSRIAEGLSTKAEERILAGINKDLGDIGLPTVPALPKWELEQIPRISSEALEVELYKEKFWFLGFIPWTKKYALTDVEARFRHELPVEFSKQIAARVKTWYEGVQKEYLKGHAMARKGSIQKHLETLQASETSRSEDRATKAKQQILFLQGMIAELTALQDEVTKANETVLS